MSIPLIAVMLLFAKPPAAPDEPAAVAPARGDDVPVMVSESEGRSGWLGVSIRDMNAEIARELNAGVTEGALVEEVTADSPADTAGLKRRDVIVEFGGRRIYDADDLRKTVRRLKPGEDVAVTIDRGGQTQTLRVRVGMMPPGFSSFGWAPAAPVAPVPPVAPHVTVVRRRGELGLRVRSVEGQLAGYFGAPEKGAVLVEEVEKDGVGAKAGFKAGDVIVKAGGKTVEDAGDIWSALEGKEKGDKVAFDVIRKGSRKTVTATMEESAVSHRMQVAPHGAHEFRWEGPDEFEFEFDEQQLKGIQESLRIQLDRTGPAMKRAQKELQIELEGMKPEMERRQKELQIELERMKPEMERARKDLKQQGERLKRELRRIRIDAGGSVRT